jgi:hypothetical protein
MKERGIALGMALALVMALGALMQARPPKTKPTAYTVMRHEYGPSPQLEIIGPDGEEWISVAQGGAVTVFYQRATPQAIHDFCRMIAGDKHIAQPVRCMTER